MNNPFKRNTINIQNDIEVHPAYVQEGDTVIVSTPRRVSQSDFDRLKAQLEAQAPGVRCVILEGGLTVEAVVARTARVEDAAL